jgi:hypothetical protein
MAYTPLRRYYRGHDLAVIRDVQAGQNRYPHYDHQGTVQCLTDSTGAVTDRRAYDAWGVEVKQTGDSINRNWYIGRGGLAQEGSTPLISDGRAYYRSLIGRWNSSSVSLGRIGESGYLPAANRITSYLGAFDVFPRDFHIARADKLRANALSSCGGAAWLVHWTPIDQEGRHPWEGGFARNLCGYFIQKVTITSEASTCPPDAHEIPEADSWLPKSWTYYEAWGYRYIHPGGSRANPSDDTFGYPGIDSVKEWTDPMTGEKLTGKPYNSSSGSWSILGDAVFIELDCPERGFPRLPPSASGWLPKEKCNQLRRPLGAIWNINLPCTLSEPSGFLTPKFRISRKLSMQWKCPCDSGCLCTECRSEVREQDLAGNPKETKVACRPNGTNCPTRLIS